MTNENQNLKIGDHVVSNQMCLETLCGGPRHGTITDVQPERIKYRCANGEMVGTKPHFVEVVDEDNQRDECGTLQHRHGDRDYWHPVARIHPVDEVTKSRFVFEKIIIRGEKYYKFTSYSNVKEYDQLPMAYVECEDVFWEGHQGIAFRSMSTVSVGDELDAEHFSLVHDCLHSAARNLHAVNIEIAELEKTHKGEITISA